MKYSAYNIVKYAHAQRGLWKFYYLVRMRKVKIGRVCLSYFSCLSAQKTPVLGCSISAIIYN